MVYSITGALSVIATKKVTFMERCDMKRIAIGLKGGLVRDESTKLRSYVVCVSSPAGRS